MTCLRPYGRDPSSVDMGMRLSEPVDDDQMIAFVDNVIATGITAEAARRCHPNSIVLALAFDDSAYQF